MNKDIDIKDILSIIKHNLLFILSIVVISILMAMIYLKFQTPKYQAEALIRVRMKESRILKEIPLFTPPSISNTKENVELLKTFYITTSS